MINNPEPLFREYASDFKYCEAIIKKYSKSFYAAFSKLPKYKAQAVYAVYASCRQADDAIDKYQDPKKLEWMARRLLAIKEAIVQARSARKVFDGLEEDAMWRALMIAFNVFDLDFAPFEDMLEGQRRDVSFTQPQTEAELSRYSYYVAGSVGLMLLPILSKQASKIQEPATQLGEAMQRTNILRDIGQDLTIQRVYLPRETMAMFNVSVEDIQQHKRHQTFIDLWEYEATQAEQLYRASYRMLPFIDRDCREALLSAALIYRENLALVRHHDYNVYNKEKREIPLARKIALVRYAEELLKAN